MKIGFLGQITNGWNDDEKEQLFRELRDSLTEEEKETASIEMIAWVAVAQK
jgi:hypothetical protein